MLNGLDVRQDLGCPKYLVELPNIFIRLSPMAPHSCGRPWVAPPLFHTCSTRLRFRQHIRFRQPQCKIVHQRGHGPHSPPPALAATCEPHYFFPPAAPCLASDSTSVYRIITKSFNLYIGWQVLNNGIYELLHNEQQIHAKYGMITGNTQLLADQNCWFGSGQISFFPQYVKAQ